eukprot:CAMPEP_0184205830 /NCGR_PEP_ID=MMETSP0976-20121227/10281_1 /TAXON_ID=483370 /ORGANISM="non described non described, Strain CCMP2097" /LENGTH=189 /DNA_ID=CAMNT_0026510445 /DNA_START=190 /DNA_END=756 /DNA_ORIENTATION=-
MDSPTQCTSKGDTVQNRPCTASRKLEARHTRLGACLRGRGTGTQVTGTSDLMPSQTCPLSNLGEASIQDGTVIRGPRSRAPQESQTLVVATVGRRVLVVIWPVAGFWAVRDSCGATLSSTVPLPLDAIGHVFRGGPRSSPKAACAASRKPLLKLHAAMHAAKKEAPRRPKVPRRKRPESEAGSGKPKVP